MNGARSEQCDAQRDYVITVKSLYFMVLYGRISGIYFVQTVIINYATGCYKLFTSNNSIVTVAHITRKNIKLSVGCHNWDT